MSAYDFNWNRDFSEEVYSRLVSSDKFICDSVLPHDPILESTLQANAAAGLNNIDVASKQGKLFYLLAKLASAKNILEIGTLGGYSALWFAKAIPADGKVVTL
jgi:predicted O-methyltransferase YrrM